MTRASIDDDRYPQADGGYWICDVCVKKRKLVSKYPTGGNTVCSGVPCDYCGEEAPGVTPIVDFKRKKSDPDGLWD